MTRDEFFILTKGSLQEALDKASLMIGVTLPNENIILVSSTSVLARGWEDACNFLVLNMYFGENKIKPCADLVVSKIEKGTTYIEVFIANYEPVPFALNWSNGVGPYIKAVSQKLLTEH